jgi:hypothetical protein
MFEKAALRKVVRGRLQSGKLPRQEPDHTWDGPGVGAPCGVCEKPVAGNEVGFEVQFARRGGLPGLDTYQLHELCFAVWERERTKA